MNDVSHVVYDRTMETHARQCDGDLISAARLVMAVYDLWIGAIEQATPRIVRAVAVNGGAGSGAREMVGRGVPVGGGGGLSIDQLLQAD